MLGLEAAGLNPLDVERNGESPIDFLRASRITSATDLERTILALEGAGIDSRSFEGRDLVAQLRSKRSGDGSWEGQVNITAFGILALRAAGQRDVERSADWLRDAQNSNGGWGFAPGRASEADSTGATMQALDVSGSSSAALSAGGRYLVQIQKGDGGWTLAGGVENSQSTAWALQGLVAAGGPGGAISEGVAYLSRRQAGDGSYRYSAASAQTPVWVTAQALTGVTRSAFPLAAVPRAPGGGGSSGSGEPGPDGSHDEEQGGGDDGSDGAGEDGGSKNGSNEKGGKRRAGGDARGPVVDGASNGASVPAGETEAPGTIAAASQAAEADGGGLSGGGAIAIGLGAIALILGGGFLWQRRGTS